MSLSAHAFQSYYYTYYYPVRPPKTAACVLRLRHFLAGTPALIAGFRPWGPARPRGSRGAYSCARSYRASAMGMARSSHWTPRGSRPLENEPGVVRWRGGKTRVDFDFKTAPTSPKNVFL